MRRPLRRDGAAFARQTFCLQGWSGGAMKRNPKWRELAAAAAVVVALGVAGAPEAKAQFFPPIGAASPGEIAARLRAQGFVLTGPLIRRDTVYLADVRGPSGHERLVLDAWSGEILQSFVSRGRNWRPGMTPYVVHGGEFSSPPPLAPPPKRDFLDPGETAYGVPGGPVILTPEGRSRKSHPAKSKATEAKAAPEPQAVSPGPAETAAPTTGAAPPRLLLRNRPRRPSRRSLKNLRWLRRSRSPRQISPRRPRWPSPETKRSTTFR